MGFTIITWAETNAPVSSPVVLTIIMNMRQMIPMSYCVVASTTTSMTPFTHYLVIVVGAASGFVVVVGVF